MNMDEKINPINEMKHALAGLLVWENVASNNEIIYTKTKINVINTLFLFLVQ